VNYLLTGLFCVSGFLQVFADAPESLRRKLPTSALYSQENAVAVYAVSEAASPLRAPVMYFADEVRQELMRGLKLKFGSKNRPLEIAVGDETNGSTRVVSGRIRSFDGVIRERIELPAPGTADLETFRTAVVGAFLRIWIEENMQPETAVEVPDWLIAGVSRYVRLLSQKGVESWRYRLEDFEAFWEAWASGTLPPAGNLLSWQMTPQTAGGVIGWLLSSQSGAVPFRTILSACAAPDPLTPAKIGLLIIGSDDLAALDASLDSWMIQAATRVSEPGTTTKQAIDRWRMMLVFFPGDYGITTADPWRPRALSEISDGADLKKNYRVFRAFALRMRLAAAGRDPMFAAVGDAYGRYLEAVASDGDAARLAALYGQAEQLRIDLQKTADVKPLKAR